MSYSDQTLSQIPTSFATVSIDNPAFLSLPEKLSAISAAGFQAIELGFPDLVSFAGQHLSKEVKEDAYDDIVTAGREVAKLCAQHKLQILMLQPFANFEGWPRDSAERADAFSRARGWIRVMEAVGTDMLQVGSTDADGVAADPDVLAADLRELADLLAAKRFRLCYENWCWATHAPTWRDVWRIVQRVDRPNVGLCLDTFQTAGGEWGDPATASGRIEAQGRGEAQGLGDAYAASLRELAATVPKDRIYLLQISDAYRPGVDLERQAKEAGMRNRSFWSHAFRPPPYDGGYLPIEQMTKAVLDTGFRSWFSMEVFDGGPDGKGKTKDAAAYLKKARASIDKLLENAEKVNL